MKITEQILWILGEGSSGLKDDECYADNIVFSHSLGLKCDCVGWTKLDLSHPDAGEILDKIEAYIREHGRTARCYYTRRYEDLESDWYELTPKQFLIDAVYEQDTVPATPSGPLYLPTIKAFMENTHTIKSWRNYHVPERFYKACIAHNIPGIQFSWTKDVGRFQAPQYFAAWPDKLLPHIGTDGRIKKRDPAAIEVAGGWLPRLAQVFGLQQIDYPCCYLRSELPEGGFVYANTERNDYKAGDYRILMHKTVLEILLAEKAIAPNSYRPALVVEEIPGEYEWEATLPQRRPTDAYIAQSFQDYEKLMAKPRPVRKITEKQALTQLRRAKRDRKEDFFKALPKAAVLPGGYEPLHPYLLITNGGYLSDEYRLLTAQELEFENAEFQADLAAEELADLPAGVVIAKCPDGDTILLLEDGKVLRMSHEAPEAIATFPTLSQFISEALSEE